MHGVESRLALAFEVPPGERHPSASRTQMRVLHQEMPQRVVRAFAGADGMAVTHLHNLSGGVLGGDQLALEVNVGRVAQAQLTTTGATRIYRHRPGPDATQQTTLRVGESALLEFLPDPLIPFADARYHQTVKVELAEGATLFYWEVVAPGREASGELFAYDELELAMELCAAAEVVALERMKLQPAVRPLISPLRWGRYRYMATLYICQVGAATKTWAALEKQLATLAAAHTCHDNPTAAVWGLSSLVAHGLVVRALGTNGRQLGAGLLEFWRAAKWGLLGRVAHPPRKVY